MSEFKVGDEVRIKPLDQIDRDIWPGFNPAMEDFVGHQTTVDSISPGNIGLLGFPFYWDKSWLEKVEEEDVSSDTPSDTLNHPQTGDQEKDEPTYQEEEKPLTELNKALMEVTPQHTYEYNTNKNRVLTLLGAIQASVQENVEPNDEWVDELVDKLSYLYD